MRKFTALPAWKAHLTDCTFWSIHAADGTTIARVTATEQAQRHAALLVDAQSLYNELAIADELLRACLNLMTLEQKTALADRAAVIHGGDGAIRAAERERLLVSHAGGQRDGSAGFDRQNRLADKSFPEEHDGGSDD